MKLSSRHLVLGLAFVHGCATPEPSDVPVARRDALAQEVDERSETPSRALERHPARATQLIFQPGDMFTNVDGMQPMVLLRRTALLTDEEVNAFQTSLALVRLPSRTEISAQVSHEPPDPETGETAHAFTITPERELSPGWYEVAIDATALPSPLQEDVASVRGRTSARFHVGQQLLARRIETSRAADGRTFITVEFSERVRATTRASSAIVVRRPGSASVPCHAVDEDMSSEDGVSVVTLSCSGLARAERVTLDFGGRLRGLAGAELRTVDGSDPRAIDVVVGDVVEIAERGAARAFGEDASVEE